MRNVYWNLVLGGLMALSGGMAFIESDRALGDWVWAGGCVLGLIYFALGVRDLAKGRHKRPEA